MKKIKSEQEKGSNRNMKAKDELKRMNSDELFTYIRENIKRALNKSENKKTGTNA